MRTFFSDRLVTLNKLIGAVGSDVSLTSSTLESPFVEPLDATGRPAYRALRAASRQDREAVKSLAGVEALVSDAHDLPISVGVNL
jgi:hypothetical protein